MSKITNHPSPITLPKSNWGNFIILAFVLFVGFICTMAYIMTAQKIDLVQDDYYQTELVFQKQIEKVNNTANLKTKIAMTYLPDKKLLNVYFPTQVVKGEVKFFRPSDQKMDIKISLKSLKESLQQFSTKMLKKGLWKVQISWSDGKQEFFNEQELYI